MLRNSRLTLLASAMAALVAAAPLTTSAMARDSQAASWRHAERAYACTATGARSSYGQSCYRDDRDVWGHWGTYYGPMIGFP